MPGSLLVTRECTKRQCLFSLLFACMHKIKITLQNVIAPWIRSNTRLDPLENLSNGCERSDLDVAPGFQLWNQQLEIHRLVSCVRNRMFRRDQVWIHKPQFSEHVWYQSVSNTINKILDWKLHRKIQAKRRRFLHVYVVASWFTRNDECWFWIVYRGDETSRAAVL